MKNIKTLAALLLIFALSACNKYLEEEVFSTAQTSNFYENEQQGISALNGAYAALRDTYFAYPNDYQLLTFLEAPTGTLTASPGANAMSYTQQEYIDLKRVWDRMWVCVNRSGTLISSLKVENIKVESAKRIIAEAKFIRALNYFNLVRMWGKVPLSFGTKTITDAYPAKVDESLIYKQIIADLEVAVQDLPIWAQYSANGAAGSGNLLSDYQLYEPGRATKGAAQALLAKVYLTIGSSMASNSNQFENAFDKMEMYNKAKDMCAAVYNGGHGYGLHAIYFDVFSEVNEHGKEDIFSINYIEASDLKLGNSLAAITASGGTGILTTEIGRVRAVPAFLTEFTTTDKRRSATFNLEYFGINNVKVLYPSTKLKFLSFKKYWSDYQLSSDNIPMVSTTYKYKTTAADKGRFGDDIPVIRYSDVLLMYSEALLALGDLANAQQRLADVRERAGLGRTIPTGNFMDLIIAERRRELCFEMQLWFDYQRLNIVSKYRTDLADVKYKYFPIPADDLMMNPGLKPQNPGW